MIVRYLKRRKPDGRDYCILPRWTAEETATLRELKSQGLTYSAIAAILGRTPGSVRGKHKKLRPKPGRKSVRNTLEYVLHRLATEVVKNSETGCLIWQGGKIGEGYGIVRLDDRSQLTHRIAYENAKGPIPDGLQIDHLCMRRACCNPDHLEPVTQAENRRRARKTHCKRGHALTDDNVYVSPGMGLRQCRKCNKIRATACRERRRRG